jgi:hypothetical protein
MTAHMRLHSNFLCFLAKLIAKLTLLSTLITPFFGKSLAKGIISILNGTA